MCGTFDRHERWSRLDVPTPLLPPSCDGADQSRTVPRQVATRGSQNAQRQACRAEKTLVAACDQIAVAARRSRAALASKRPARGHREVPPSGRLFRQCMPRRPRHESPARLGTLRIATYMKLATPKIGTSKPAGVSLRTAAAPGEASPLLRRVSQAGHGRSLHPNPAT
jgi:hypothetical protein